MAKSRMDLGLGAKAAHTIYPLFVGNALGVIIAGFKIIIATRLLGPALFGMYVFIVSYYSLIGSVNDLGISSYFKKYAAELDYKKDGEGMQRMLSAGFFVVTGVSLLLAVIGIALSGFVASGSFNSVGATQQLLELGSVVLFTTIMFGALSSILIGLGEGRRYSLAYLTFMASDFIITVYSLLAGYGAFGILIGTLVGSVLGIILSLFYVRKHLNSYMSFCPWRFEAFNIKRVLGFAWPLAISNFLTNSMSNFSVIFIGFFVSGIGIGNYGTALKGLIVLSVFYSSVVTVLLPTFSEAAKKNRGKEYNEGVFNASVLYSVFVTFPILLYFAVFSKSLIYFFIGSSYALAPAYLTLIAIGTIIGLVGSFSSTLLTARGLTYKMLKYGAVSSLLQFVAMLSLVPYFGVIGAIAGIFFIGSVANTLLFSSAVRKIIGIRLQKLKLLRLVAANMALLGLMLIPRFAFGSVVMEALVGGAILVIVYPALVAVSGAINKKELDYFRNSTAKLFVAGRFIGWIVRYMEIVGG